MQRTRRSSHGGSDYSIDDDHEMEAMAKVWAHPEDLHLFPVSAQCCFATTAIPLQYEVAEHTVSTSLLNMQLTCNK